MAHAVWSSPASLRGNHDSIAASSVAKIGTIHQLAHKLQPMDQSAKLSMPSTCELTNNLTSTRHHLRHIGAIATGPRLHAQGHLEGGRTTNACPAISSACCNQQNNNSAGCQRASEKGVKSPIPSSSFLGPLVCVQLALATQHPHQQKPSQVPARGYHDEPYSTLPAQPCRCRSQNRAQGTIVSPGQPGRSASSPTDLEQLGCLGEWKPVIM